MFLNSYDLQGIQTVLCEIVDFKKVVNFFKIHNCLITHTI